jgi:hypothetical protein
VVLCVFARKAERLLSLRGGLETAVGVDGFRRGEASSWTALKVGTGLYARRGWPVKTASSDPRHFDRATWLHKAQSLPKEQFKQGVEREMRLGRGSPALRDNPYGKQRQIDAKGDDWVYNADRLGVQKGNSG